MDQLYGMTPEQQRMLLLSGFSRALGAGASAFPGNNAAAMGAAGNSLGGTFDRIAAQALAMQVQKQQMALRERQMAQADKQIAQAGERLKLTAQQVKTAQDAARFQNEQRQNLITSWPDMQKQLQAKGADQATIDAAKVAWLSGSTSPAVSVLHPQAVEAMPGGAYGVRDAFGRIGHLYTPNPLNAMMGAMPVPGASMPVPEAPTAAPGASAMPSPQQKALAAMGGGQTTTYDDPMAGVTAFLNNGAASNYQNVNQIPVGQLPQLIQSLQSVVPKLPGGYQQYANEAIAAMQRRLQQSGQIQKGQTSTTPTSPAGGVPDYSHLWSK